MRIGMFDSGVGGLTVLKEFLSIMPNNEYIYFGDTKRIPYGNKSKEAILSFSREIVEFLLQKEVDIIVVACNTVSATCLSELQKEYSIPLIGVVEPTIEYIKKNNYQSLGLIGTIATINSKIYPNNLSDIKIIDKPCPLLVPAIEENLCENELMDDILDLYLSPYKNTNIQGLILACTHYPIIENKIKKYLDTTIINPASITAEYVFSKYENKASSKKIELYFSDVNDTTLAVGTNILGFDIKEYINLAGE